MSAFQTRVPGETPMGTMMPPMGPPMGTMPPMGPPMGTMPPMGPPMGSMPPMGPPMGTMPGMPPMGPPMGTRGPPYGTMMPPGPMGSMGMPMPPVPPAAMEALKVRLNADVARANELNRQLSYYTGYEYDKGIMPCAEKAHLRDVDWRVPRLMLCKDPKYNAPLGPNAIPPARKLPEGKMLEEQLAMDAYENWRQELVLVDRVPPPEETVFKPGAKFFEVDPNYRKENDVWERQLALRTLDEALRGNIGHPMPRPVLFAEDYENFKEGKYIKDDCPIA